MSPRGKLVTDEQEGYLRTMDKVVTLVGVTLASFTSQELDNALKLAEGALSGGLWQEPKQYGKTYKSLTAQIQILKKLRELHSLLTILNLQGDK